ncbi:MAG: redoxin domain-containing protein, partial [Planctomycetota bacterium]
ARSPERALRLWLSEAAAKGYETMDIAPDPNIPSPSADAVAATDSVPSVPLRPQPWTVRETEALEFLIARYKDGATQVQAPRNSGYGRRRTRAQSVEEGSGDPVLSSKFMGTELPWTRFNTADGEVVDMDDYRGKKKVVLVVLRGFAREVCVYCVTQTEALCDSIAEFQERNCEVFVVYPGEKNRLDVFMESFEKISKHMGVPPVGVLYDRNMELVDRMGITSEFAIPSTFILDEGGVIRYSYVGEEIDDRPAATTILDAVDGMTQP